MYERYIKITLSNFWGDFKNENKQGFLPNLLNKYGIRSSQLVQHPY